MQDANFHDILEEDSSEATKNAIEKWAKTWYAKEGISEHIMSFLTDLKKTLPGKCKPLIKTHKAKPYPMGLLLSGTGTPVQPICKFVQVAISHLTGNLPYQIIDTKEFLQ